MIPAIASGGRSFQGAFAYYMHDKGAKTTARIAWTHTMNMMTDCVDKAWKVMAYTARAQQRLKEATGQKLSGRKLEKPFFAYSLAWHPEQKPDKQAMLEAAKQSLDKLGFTGHEVAIVAHNDEPHRHLHIIVNRVHPVTGIAAKRDYSKRKLSKWAHEYELKQGKVYCKMREENQRKREQGQHTKYNDPNIVQAWERSHNAYSFHRLLENRDYHLARGRKRIVVVDPHDKAHNPTRHLKGIATAQEVRERMEGLDHKKLPTVEAVVIARRRLREEHRQRVSAHEDRAAEALGKTFSRHYQEQEKLMVYHDHRIDKKRNELEDYYKLTEKQEQIGQLKGQLNNPGIFQRLSFKMFRSDQRLREKITLLEATEANAKERFDEAIASMEQERTRSLKSLEKRHARELEELKEHLSQWTPTEKTLRQEWSRASHERDRNQEHSYEAPGLDR